MVDLVAIGGGFCDGDKCYCGFLGGVACRIYVLLLLLPKEEAKTQGLYGGKGRAKADVF